MTPTWQQAFGRMGRNARLLLLVTGLLGFSFWGIHSLLLNLYLLRLGYGPEFVGVVNAVGLIAFTACCLPFGALGQRYRSRTLMLIGVSVSVGGFVALPCAEFAPTALRSGWLITTYTLSALGLALYAVHSAPALIEASAPEERPHVYALASAIQPLTGFLGNLVGGLLPGWIASVWGMAPNHPASFRYPLWLAALILSPAIWALASLKDDHPRTSAAATASDKAAPWGLIILIGGVALLRQAGVGASRSFFNVYLDDALRISTAGIGALSGIAQIISVAGAMVAPSLILRWGNGRTVLWGTLGVALSQLPLALVPHWSAAGLGRIGMMSLGAVAGTAFQVYQMELVAPPWRATMAGATAMAETLGWAALALGGGYLITTLGYSYLFLLGAGLTAAGSGLFWLHWRRRSAQP